MLRLCIAFAAVGLLLTGLVPAAAGVVVTVNKSTQRLTVEVNGVPRYDWPVSTARLGYRTPNGVYRPQRLERKWFSRKYDWSPMPHSIFFHHGYAIHGSNEIRKLGRPASHGCIRLEPRNAAELFSLVSANRGNTRIVITGERPSHRAIARQTREEKRATRLSARPAEPRRHSARPTEQRPRQRVTQRRTPRHQADFDDVFVAPRYARGRNPNTNWREWDSGRGWRQGEWRRW